MQLGDVLSSLRDEAAATEILMGCGDLKLFLAVADAAARFGEAPGDYASGSVRRFADGAGDEDWLALMTALERSDDPAETCLVTMVRWSLKQDSVEEPATGTCGCGGGHGCGS